MRYSALPYLVDFDVGRSFRQPQPGLAMLLISKADEIVTSDIRLLLGFYLRNKRHYGVWHGDIGFLWFTQLKYRLRNHSIASAFCDTGQIDDFAKPVDSTHGTMFSERMPRIE